MIKWSEISSIYKVLAAIVAGIAALAAGHYAEFQTVRAADLHERDAANQWASVQQSIDEQSLIILKRELRGYERELANLPENVPADDKYRVWLEDQIAEIKDAIEKIEAKQRPT